MLNCSVITIKPTGNMTTTRVLPTSGCIIRAGLTGLSKEITVPTQLRLHPDMHTWLSKGHCTKSCPQKMLTRIWKAPEHKAEIVEGLVVIHQEDRGFGGK